MENFSTVGARLAIATFFSSVAIAGTQAATCEFLPNAPDRHVVLQRDTLWGISARFLEHPWCWGQVWGMNRDEIHNPHWIYPGQIVYLERAAGRLRLGGKVLTDDGASSLGQPPIVRLSPRLRTEGLDQDAVASIPAGAIEPFLSQPLIIEADQLRQAPRIVATQENHVFLGKGDKAYVQGNLNGNISFQVFRPGQLLSDPVSGVVIAHEAFYLGTVMLRTEATAGSGVHAFVVTSAQQEMGRGDRLLPVPPIPMRNYVPHPPEQQVNGRIMSIYGGVTYAAQNQVVSINRGALDGLDSGCVLQLYHEGAVSDAGGDEGEGHGKGEYGIEKLQVTLPDEQYGTLFIFRVFQHISYGLIMQVTQPVQIGDGARSPE